MTELSEIVMSEEIILCHVDNAEYGCIKGWVSYRDHSKFCENIELYFNSKFITEISCNNFREDLLQAKVGSGYGAFECDYLSELSEEEGIVDLVYKEEKLFSSLVRKKADVIKNADYGLVEFVNTLIKKNKLPEIMPGVEVNLLPSSMLERIHYGDKFTRIINKTNKNRIIDVSDKLISVVKAGDIICVGCTAEDDTYLMVEFYDAVRKNINQSYRIDIKKNKLLTEYEVLENISDVGVVNYKINIPPLSSVDLGSIVICEKLQRLHGFEKKYSLEYEKVVNTEKVISFLGQDSPTFKPQRKKQVVEGLVYEEKNKIENEIGIIIENGIAIIQTGLLTGYSRVSSPVELSPYDSNPFKISISVDTGSDDIFKGCYIYADGENGKTLNKLKLKKVVRDECVFLESTLSLKQTHDLFKALKDYEIVKVALEFSGNSTYRISEIKIGQFSSDASIYSPSSLGFEDEALESQVSGVNSFNKVYKNEKTSIENKSIKRITINADECIDIVIPVYNAKEFVIECIESIQANTSINHRIILMDDSSTDGISEYLKNLSEVTDNVTHVRHEINIGYTGNVNIGMSNASSEWVVLLNSDTVVSQFWLENMLEVAKLHPAVGIVGPLGNAASWQSIPNVFTEEGAWDFNLLPEGLAVNEVSRALAKLSHLPPVEAGVLNGFCQLINAKAYNEVGRLDEESFPQGYGEENDLCARLIKNNYKLLVCPTAYVYHYKSKSFGHELRGELSKVGNDKLKELHPDYDWKLVTQRFYKNQTMEYVREFSKEIFTL